MFILAQELSSSGTDDFKLQKALAQEVNQTPI